MSFMLVALVAFAPIQPKGQPDPLPRLLEFSQGIAKVAPTDTPLQKLQKERIENLVGYVKKNEEMFRNGSTGPNQHLTLLLDALLDVTKSQADQSKCYEACLALAKFNDTLHEQQMSTIGRAANLEFHFHSNREIRLSIEIRMLKFQEAQKANEKK
jgi:hypothetical protein